MTPIFERVAPGSLRVDRRFSKLLPEPKNLAGIRTSIVREGAVLVPLLVTRDGLVLDGHHRLKIALEIGLANVPVIRLGVGGASSWAKALAITANLHRRHINEAQRVALGTSLERVERIRAKERQRAAGGDRRRRTASRRGAGKRSSRNRHEGETTAQVARRVGVSQRTYERARHVLASDPVIARKMLSGRFSVLTAHSLVRRKEVGRSLAAESAKHEPGLYRGKLGGVPGGRYRCILVDPPWADPRGPRGPGVHYRTLPVDEIAAHDVGRLAHPDGAHLWVWTTWPAIRSGSLQRLVSAWGFTWVSEFVWVKHRTGLGVWLRSQSEVCVLAVRGHLPLLVRDQSSVLHARRDSHSRKPSEGYEVFERCSPGPRIELFARDVPQRWDGWGIESRRSPDSG